jgi:hypothetical protein
MRGAFWTGSLLSLGGDSARRLRWKGKASLMDGPMVEVVRCCWVEGGFESCKARRGRFAC